MNIFEGGHYSAYHTLVFYSQKHCSISDFITSPLGYLIILKMTDLFISNLSLLQLFLDTTNKLILTVQWLLHVSNSLTFLLFLVAIPNLHKYLQAHNIVSKVSLNTTLRFHFAGEKTKNKTRLSGTSPACKFNLYLHPTYIPPEYRCFSFHPRLSPL